MKKLSLITGAAALAIAGPAYAQSDAPIVVGSINALSGPVVYDDASKAAKAVFDAFNENGGHNGRMIEYLIMDDRTDPATSSSSARDAVDNQGAVAMVGSMSFLDCAVNGAYYIDKGIVAIPGLGADTFCYTNANIAPPNMGPYLASELTMQIATEELGLDKICAVVGVGGGAEAAYREGFAKWTERTGADFEWIEFIPYSAPDFTPYVIRAKEAGCETIYFNGPDELALSMMNAASAQDAAFSYLLFVPAYTEAFANASPSGHNGVYIVSEFAPYTDPTAEATADWYTLMQEKGVPITAFSQGGYLSATYFIEMLGRIDGEITRESVTQAFKTQTDPIENPMVGAPYVFGDAEMHSPNRAGWLVKMAPGSSQWESVGENWSVLADEG